jgi:hypothetical protein
VTNVLAASFFLRAAMSAGKHQRDGLVLALVSVYAGADAVVVATSISTQPAAE